jgi:Mn2+/Fe2+ NRAMP family transporter
MGKFANTLFNKVILGAVAGTVSVLNVMLLGQIFGIF